MKPLKLEMQAFGPYRNRETIDFEKLSQSGIFLIKGPTGSGKTTIFDAMTYALYGGSSGDDEKKKNGRNEIKEWRCNQAEWGNNTYVAFTFSVGGKVYRFTRGAECKKKNLLETYAACRIEPDGTELQLFENPKSGDLNQKTEELLGLTKDQFRQVMLLPQGQFERFLTADSRDKETLLSKIFDAEIWKGYADKFFDKVKARKDALDEENKAVMTSLAEESRSGRAAFTEPGQLKLYIDELKKEAADNEERHAAFAGNEKQEKLNADIALAEQFATLHGYEHKAAELKAEQQRIAEAKAKLADAENAEELRPFLEKLDKAAAEALKRKQQHEKLKNSLPAAEMKAAAAAEAFEKHNAESPAAKLQNRIGELEAKRETYNSLESLKALAENAAAALKKAASVKNRAAQKLNKAAADAKAAYETSMAAEDNARALRTAYYAGIYGEIAGELKDGVRCPVCGSLEHPQPAVKAEGSISR